MTTPLSLDEVEFALHVWKKEEYRRVSMDREALINILETARTALKVVEKAKAFLQEDSGKIAYHELDASLAPFRAGEKKC